MSALVHLAGLPVRVGDVIRQRCAWCGALIDDLDLTRVAVALEPGQTDDDARRMFVDDDGNPVRGWDGFVAVDDAGAMIVRYQVPHPADGSIPAGSCMNLDPAATA